MSSCFRRPRDVPILTGGSCVRLAGPSGVRIPDVPAADMSLTGLGDEAALSRRFGRELAMGYAPRMEPLVDGWGREIRSVRVSVTDKCNFRCTYCMPAEGLAWLPKPEILTFEEIARLVSVLARMGVREVRLTGGEPLVRRDLPDLVRMLATIPGVDDLSLTTNRVLDVAPLPLRGRRRRGRLRQPGLGALLLDLRPDPRDRRRPAPDLPLLEARVGSEVGASLDGDRRRARGDDPPRGAAQGAQAPDQRSWIRP